jgi:hypothetical protein
LKSKRLGKKEGQLSPLNFKTTKVMPHVDKMFDLFNKSYASLSLVCSDHRYSKEYFKKKYISFINPEFISLLKIKTITLLRLVIPDFAGFTKIER